MPLHMEKFFSAIFKPNKGEVVTVLYDIPHANIKDNDLWLDRRQMAMEWRSKINSLSDKFGIKVNPVVGYFATGASNSDLPAKCFFGDHEAELSEVVLSSNIIISMPEFSASAPLIIYTKRSDKLRVASMPGVERFMEETGLSADYEKVAERCKKLKKYFVKSVGAEVEFSTNHKCYFDISVQNHVFEDTGLLYPEVAGKDGALCNLPAGEVCITPNEKNDSKTNGELPQKVGDELVVYKIRNNKISEVVGEGNFAKEIRGKMEKDPAWRNIAEFAIGCNDKAKVTGNILEDEKAGFHWAYGRSDHLGGVVGAKNFISPSNVIHQDIVYAKGNPIVCKKLDMIEKDGSRTTLIVDGELKI